MWVNCGVVSGLRQLLEVGGVCVLTAAWCAASGSCWMWSRFVWLLELVHVDVQGVGWSVKRVRLVDAESADSGCVRRHAVKVLTSCGAWCRLAEQGPGGNQYHHMTLSDWEPAA